MKHKNKASKVGPWKQYRDLNIYANPLGDIKYISRGGNDYAFKQNKYYYHDSKKGYFIGIKSNDKVYVVRRIVWECFNGPIPKGYYIVNKDGSSYNNSLSNLIMIKEDTFKRRSNNNKSQRFVIDKTNNKVYKGSREAANKLHIDKSCVIDYCNGKVKNSLYQLEWGGLVSGEDL